jgi:hypothetical protein
MTNEYKTLRELNVQPGDVVVNNLHGARPVAVYRIEGGDFWSKSMRMSRAPVWRIVSRASDTPKLLRDMTDAEIGALVRAKNEGKVIEVLDSLNGAWVPAPAPGWWPRAAYRVRPEPKRETVTYTWGEDVLAVSSLNRKGTHHITFDLIDGRPDCDSIKMEEL